MPDPAEYAAPSAVPDAVDTPGSLPWQIARLERASGELADTIDVLRMRVRHVLPEAVDPLVDSAVVAGPLPVSTHGGNLDGIAQRVERMIDDVRRLIDSVDV